MTLPEPNARSPQAAAAEAPSPRRLSGLSIQILVVWALLCAAQPAAILLPAPETTTMLVAMAAGLTLVSVAIGIAYAMHVGLAWYLMQACMLAGVFLGAYCGNRWLFVGESAMMIYLCFSLYTREVREEFSIHAAPREIGVLLVLLGMCAALAILRREFLEGGNLLLLALQFSMVGIMAVGMTMVIILGGIDLSVGSIVALAGCLATLAIHNLDCPLWVAVVIALASGAAVGAVNGVLISSLRMAPFVITLGTMSMARSLAIVVTGAEQVTVKGRLAQPAFVAIAQADTLGVPNSVWLMAFVVLAGHIFLRDTRTGRHVYYIGANEEAARLSGLNVTWIKWGVYSVCGLLAGLAGLVQAARLETGQPTAGIGDELRVIAAVIIGGASFSGGVGTVLGAILGAAIMGVLRQGIILLGIDPNWGDFVQGGVIIGAVALDMLRRRR
jgi:ribose/xylose/arabinose/galactoside ABC-type transport system permease subunit